MVTKEDFIFSGTELTSTALDKFMKKHDELIVRYDELKKQYISKPPILDEAPKDSWKPDNRLVANYSKYIIDTFTGYCFGIPVKVKHKNENIEKKITDFWKLNKMDDLLPEAAKQASLYGKAYGLIWQDKEARTRFSLVSPYSMFFIYGDDIERTPKFAVYLDYGKDVTGTILSNTYSQEFIKVGDEIVISEPLEHFYRSLPAVEFIENSEAGSLIDPVETLINAYNKAISEKANDTDYFADAYMAVIGARIKDSEIDIRDSRIINIYKEDASSLAGFDVKFLEKPDGDTTQENLLDRLEDLIFKLAMVANISDESYGNASGTALEFKLQPMKNLALMKHRKFESALDRLFEIFFGLPTNIASSFKDEYINIEYKFTLNMPRNLSDEADTAAKLEGIVSKETQLSTLSIVTNPKEEMDKMNEDVELY